MEAELKVGDEVCFRNTPGAAQKKGRFKIIEVKAIEPKYETDTVDKNLYDREIDKLNMPQVSYVIESLQGGEKFNASQGEIDLA